MFIANAVESYSLKLKRVYEMLNELSLTGKIVLSIAMAFSIGILAQVRVFLPWTPVPIVMTQIGIVTYAALMGKRWGVVPVMMYVLGGMAGIPWFSGFGSGAAYLTGPTGGYIVGFILSAWFVSNLCSSEKIKGKIIPLTVVIIVSQLVIVYLPGLIQLDLWFRTAGNGAIGLPQLLTVGYFPFVIGDILKSVIAAIIVFTIGRR